MVVKTLLDYTDAMFMKSCFELNPQQREWLECLKDGMLCYLQKLELKDQPGRFLPCVNGATELGRQVVLGFSCFALKLYYTLRLWQDLTTQKRNKWTALIQSFQANGCLIHDKVAHNAFLDPPVVAHTYSRIPRFRKFLYRVFPPKGLTYPQRVIIAETKQAIASLEQVGERAIRPYHGFPVTPEGVKGFLVNLDWTNPWEAGGQASALVVFLKTQALSFLEFSNVKELLDVCTRFFEDLAHSQTGAYFKGDVPEHGELINGAMKVLTALDWLEVSIHYPEELINTCLERLPDPEGCHLVDSVYVLYRCLQYSQQRKADVQAYCIQVLDMIKRHHNKDGGFSYNIGRSQTHYYGVPISKGYAVSDIHGTCLLTWAVAMILEILDNNWIGWNVIRP